jgi:hypothetical protein
MTGTAGFMAGGAAREEAQRMYSDLTERSVKCRTDTSGVCADAEGTMDKAIALTAVGVAGAAVSVVGSVMVVYELGKLDPQARKANARLAVMPALNGGALKVIGRF